MNVRRWGLRRRALALALTAAALWLAGSGVRAQAPDEAPDVEVLWELMVLSRGPEGVQVAHLVHLANPGPRPASAVPLAVPEGVRWLNVPAGLITEGSRAVDPQPLDVGEERRYLVFYEIPWQRLPMAVRRAILYPTRELHIWVRTGELIVRGVNLLAGDRADFEGVPVDTYAMVDLQPHPAWQIVLDSPASAASRLPNLSPVGHRGDPLEFLRAHPLPKVMLALFAMAGIVTVVRRARPGTASGAPHLGGAGGERSAGRKAQIEKLKDEIVRVDVAFRNGELDAATYAERRAELKALLLALLAAEEAPGASEGDEP